jgi:hypothetical protein
MMHIQHLRRSSSCSAANRAVSAAPEGPSSSSSSSNGKTGHSLWCWVYLMMKMPVRVGYGRDVLRRYGRGGGWFIKLMK